MKLSADAQTFVDAPPERQQMFWDRLGEWTERERDFKRWLAAMDDPTDGWPDEPLGRLLSPPKWTPTQAKPLKLDGNQADPGALDAMPPREYWERLTGDEVSRSGHARCPLPDHSDATPSCVVYAEVGRGWWCPVCNVGGNAINLASHLSGITPKGKGYHDVLRWIGERL